MVHLWALQTIFIQGRFQILSKSYSGPSPRGLHSGRPPSEQFRMDRFEMYKSFQVDLFPTCSAPRYGDGYIDPDQQLDITSC